MDRYKRDYTPMLESKMTLVEGSKIHNGGHHGLIGANRIPIREGTLYITICCKRRDGATRRAQLSIWGESSLRTSNLQPSLHSSADVWYWLDGSHGHYPPVDIENWGRFEAHRDTIHSHGWRHLSSISRNRLVNYFAVRKRSCLSARE